MSMLVPCYLSPCSFFYLVNAYYLDIILLLFLASSSLSVSVIAADGVSIFLAVVSHSTLFLGSSFLSSIHHLDLWLMCAFFYFSSFYHPLFMVLVLVSLSSSSLLIPIIEMIKFPQGSSS